MGIEFFVLALICVALGAVAVCICVMVHPRPVEPVSSAVDLLQQQYRHSAVKAAAANTDSAPTVRAERLLNALLTPAQREEYRRTSTITVPLRSTDFAYDRAVIGRNISGVNWMPRTGWGPHYQCVYVRDYVVKQDDLISKLLLLRNDPEKLAKVSRFNLRRIRNNDWFARFR